MDPGFYAYQSNSLEVLLERFRHALFKDNTAPFHSRLVVVPHAAMKSWLQYRLASHPSTGIATGMRILTEHAAMSELLNGLTSERDRQVPNSLDLSLAIETILNDLLDSKITLNSAEEELLAPLMALFADPTYSKVKSQRRVLQLAQELARLFDSYGRHGARAILEWSSQKMHHWQIWLWNRLFARFAWWQTPVERVAKAQPNVMTPPTTVALFGSSYLPPLYQRLLHTVSQTTPVLYFVPSVCQHYWGDVCSLKETRASEGLQEQETNALLASLGRVGRKMAVAIEELPFQTQREYYIPEELVAIPSYAERLTEDTYIYPESRPKSLLQLVQADITLLRNPTNTPAIDLLCNDDSLHIHGTPTKLREVEALYNTCLQLIETHQLSPSDILVMAPDIGIYQATIAAVFGRECSQIAYRIHDQQLATQSVFVHAFNDLLELATSRWETTAVLRLLENPLVMGKTRFSEDDSYTIREWVRGSTITWGWDLDHRNSLLKKAHCASDMRSDAVSGTWQHGIQQLLRGLAESQASSVLSFSDTDLFNRWNSWLQSLWADLEPLREECSMTLREWAKYFECLIDAYLQTKESQEGERQRLLDILARFTRAYEAFPQTTFSFSSMRSHLQQQIASETLTSSESDLQAIRCGSFHALSGVPARVVLTIGLDETAFPSKSAARSLDLLQKDPKADAVPLPADIDRYHFLLAFLAARDVFGMSYVNTCPKDGKEQSPSLIVSELQSYLNRSYRLGNRPAGDAIVCRHPFFPFDAAYFQAESTIRSYSKADYEAAQALYQEEKVAPAGFLPELYTASETSPVQRTSLSIADLKQVAKNPLKFYLKHSVEMTLHNLDDTMIPDEEPFVFSGLDRYTLRDETLRSSAAAALQVASTQQRFPLGIFSDYLQQVTQTEAQAHQVAIQDLGTSISELFDIELSETCQEPRRISSTTWLFPSLKVQLADGTPLSITGKLSDITPRGLLTLGACESKRLIRVWPALLILEALRPIIQGAIGYDIPPQILFIDGESSIARDFSGRCKGVLEAYLDYALLALSRPSPLLDEWVEHFVRRDEPTIQRKIDESLKSDNFFHEEAKWILLKGKPLADIFFWQQQAQRAYGKVLAKEDVE